jgi:hypothetical protein
MPGTPLLEHFAHPRDGAAGAHAGDNKGVQALLGRVQDLERRRLPVRFGVGGFSSCCGMK